MDARLSTGMLLPSDIGDTLEDLTSDDFGDLVPSHKLSGVWQISIDGDGKHGNANNVITVQLTRTSGSNPIVTKTYFVPED